MIQAKSRDPDLQLVRRAFQFAHRAHREQKRLSGDPYIIHPLAVATILSEWGLDTTTIAAALLHDVVEDTEYGEDSIRENFGEEIHSLVKAVTKISIVKKESTQNTKEYASKLKEKEAAENIRLMLLATARDVRVILIKLADKTHNMRTLEFQKPEKIKRIANEVINIYAPIAGRLGMFRVKSELEDLAFGKLHDEDFQTLIKSLTQTRSETEDFIKKIKKILKQRLDEISISARIEGRAKHLYSIWQKMTSQQKSIQEIYDVRGIRIIVKEIRDCYGALGIAHTLWHPIHGRFKDYIATPKVNGYQSLHTTVVGPDGKPLEIQIRTEEMEERADHGIAAHWLYKHQLDDKPDQGRLRWLQTLSKISTEFQGESGDFIEDLRQELNPLEVYVFTPKGDIIDLPTGASVLDFAFRIHTEVGLRCRGAKVNDRIVPLRTELKSGDRIEILTEKSPNPSPGWFRYLHSPRAKQKLRAFLRKIEEEEEGILSPDSHKEEAIPTKNEQDLRIRRKKTNNPKEVPIEVAGQKDIPVRYAGCCSPVPGDRIVGFVTRGRGVTIHRIDCLLLPKEKERLISVRWEGLTEKYPVRINVQAEDRQGVYLELVGEITKTHTNILKAEADIPRNGNQTMKASFLIEVEHVDHLNDIIESLSVVPGVQNVERVQDTRQRKTAESEMLDVGLESAGK